MDSYFKLKSKIKLSEIGESTKIPESDFSFMDSGEFYQFEYVDTGEHVQKDIKVKSGLYALDIQNQQIVLNPTSFTKENWFEEYEFSKLITSKIDTFMSKIDIYKKFGMDPKRAILLYGAAGCGKSTTISTICTEYANKADTLVVTWPSDRLDARQVKAFLKRFDYEANNVKHLILVIEDLGGAEYDRGSYMVPSMSSLLSLLDNVERTFTIPTMILATTNHPEKFLENLTDRPQRFDDVMEVPPPTAEFRAKFLSFFSKGAASDEILTKIKDKKYSNLSVAHIKEVVIRSAIYDIPMDQAIEQIYEQSSKAKKGFSKGKTLGMGQ
jgi:AAA+ superfamily predicted ATPase